MNADTGLKLRRGAIDTFKENVAYVHRECNVYRSEGFQALSKIEVCGEGTDQQILTTLNVVDDESITTPGQLGLSHEAFQQLGLPEGSVVSVSHARPAVSLGAVHRKIAGERLDQVAERTYGDPALWRLVASVNGIDDPARFDDPASDVLSAVGGLLRLPPMPRRGEQ